MSAPHCRYCWFVCGLIPVWLVIGLFGWSALLRHTFEPSATEDTAERLSNSDSQETFASGSQIIIFAHPLCPCTRATLDKLNESLTRLPSETSIRIVFATYGLDDIAVNGSSTVAYARTLPGIEVQFDSTGKIARQFHARVSGEVFAFDRLGECIFHGGLTSGRGHLGDSVGQTELERRVSKGCHERYVGPVFGCLLPLGKDLDNEPETHTNVPASKLERKTSLNSHRGHSPNELPVAAF